MSFISSKMFRTGVTDSGLAELNSMSEIGEIYVNAFGLETPSKSKNASRISKKAIDELNKSRKNRINGFDPSFFKLPADSEDRQQVHQLLNPPE